MFDRHRFSFKKKLHCALFETITITTKYQLTYVFNCNVLRLLERSLSNITYPVRILGNWAFPDGMKQINGTRLNVTNTDTHYVCKFNQLIV